MHSSTNQNSGITQPIKNRQPNKKCWCYYCFNDNTVTLLYFNRDIFDISSQKMNVYRPHYCFNPTKLFDIKITKHASMALLIILMPGNSMKHSFRKCILTLCILPYTHVSAISVVYNFRIAQITRQPLNNANSHRHKVVSVLPFNTYLKKYNGGIRQNFAGCFGSFIYNVGAYYVRADGAFAHVQETIRHIPNLSVTETDDFLFSAGREFAVSEQTKLNLSGLLGFPTHNSYSLQRVALGTGQIGTGIQLDGTTKFHKQAKFIYGTRLLYFIKDIAQTTAGKDYLFTAGKLADILVALSNHWGLHHGLEGGYSIRWLFDAQICPKLDNIIDQTNVTSNSFYLLYKYGFETDRTSQRLLFNISYGFDLKPKLYGYKNIVTVWAAWAVNF